MTTEIQARVESFILAFGLTIARAASDWSEAQALLNTGKDSKRGVSKTAVGSRRVVEHDIDGSTADGKKKLAAFKAAAGTLNAADVVLTAEMQEELEALRIALKKADKALPVTPASK